MIRADEAHHRDVNHNFADVRAGVDIQQKAVSPYPPHAADLRIRS